MTRVQAQVLGFSHSQLSSSELEMSDDFSLILIANADPIALAVFFSRINVAG